MHRKSETFDKYQDFCEKVEKQLALLIKTLWFDRCEEYLSGEFLGYLIEWDIISINHVGYSTT